MSRQRITTIKICQRAAYFLFSDVSKQSKVITDRELIRRCYQIS